MLDYLKTLPRHFIFSLISIIRHFTMTLSSASAVAVTISLLSIFMIVFGNMGNFTKHVEKDLKIHVSIDKVATPEEIAVLQQQIESIKGIKSVSYSNKEQELKILIDEKERMFDRYKESNPMNDVFIVEVLKAKSIPKVTKALNALAKVEEAQYGGESIEKMIQAFAAFRFGGIFFLIGLGFVAIFLISNTIKMSIYTRKKEISIMRSVGATNAYIKTPFMFEGMLIGIIGSIIPILFTLILYSFMYHALNGYFLSSMFVLEPIFPFIVWICVSLLIAGAIVGIIGSLLAVTKYLRWSR